MIPDSSQTDSIGSNFTLERSYDIGSGDAAVRVNVYTGIYLDTLRLTWHALDADCTPVSMTYYGTTANGTVMALFLMKPLQWSAFPSLL